MNDPLLDEPVPLKFGLFIQPQHDPRGNPTLQIERDLELIELADRLGFDEAWVGEHLSNGYETIASPEQFLAAASQRTCRIRLGTGVNSLPYHHPFTLANRLVLLDHLSRGRAMMGFGPGQSARDAAMMGIDHKDVRDRMAEAAEAIVMLIRGHTVTRQTSWFALNGARLQLSPYNGEFDFAVASVFSPAGSTLAGRLGLGMLSLGAADKAGLAGLEEKWANLQAHAAENGHTVSRAGWRVEAGMHLAETAEQARREVRTRILSSSIFFADATQVDDNGQRPSWQTDPDAAVEKWVTDGLIPLGGVGTVGTPDDAIATIRRLLESSGGGFGTFLIHIHDTASWEATKRSLQLFAEYVIPEFSNANAPRHESARTAIANRERDMTAVHQAIDRAREQYGAKAS